MGITSKLATAYGTWYCVCVDESMLMLGWPMIATRTLGRSHHRH